MSYLTPEEETEFNKYKPEILKLGLNTNRAKRPEVEAGIAALYQLYGFDKPEFVWLESPAERMKQDDVDNQTLFENYWGSLEMYWVAFYKWCVDNKPDHGFTDKQINEVNAWFEASKAGWWWPYEGLCYISEPPTNIKLNDAAQPVLHNPTGAALEYSDGFAIYAWNGTQIPEQWIKNPESVDPALALNWENIEQRRCLCEILGWQKIIDQLQPTVIDKDPDPEIGELLEVDLPNSGKERFLKVQCGTKREFVLPVPPETKTALEGNAWTYGVDSVDIAKLEVRT